MLACRENEDYVGFVLLKPTSEVACEIHVIAVRRAYHRQGVGRALVVAAADWAKQHSYRILHVKTLGASHPSRHYAATRRFYEALEFIPLEEVRGLWPNLPCLIMMRLT